MDGRSPATILVLSGKSPQEDALALSLKWRSDTVKLIDEEESETRVLVGSEAEGAIFDPRTYMGALSTSRFVRLLILSPKIPSTHDLVSKWEQPKPISFFSSFQFSIRLLDFESPALGFCIVDRNFAELSLGTVCVSDLQYKGRGRVKNVWESPIGCLLFSFTLQMEGSCLFCSLPNLDVRIKWPNDLYLNGLKVGGILCTSTYRSKNFNVCAGNGLNLDNENPTTCLNAALQEINPSSLCLSREEVLA